MKDVISIRGTFRWPFDEVFKNMREHPMLDIEVEEDSLLRTQQPIILFGSSRKAPAIKSITAAA